MYLQIKVKILKLARLLLLSLTLSIGIKFRKIWMETAVLVIKVSVTKRLNVVKPITLHPDSGTTDSIPISLDIENSLWKLDFGIFWQSYAKALRTPIIGGAIGNFVRPSNPHDFITRTLWETLVLSVGIAGLHYIGKEETTLWIWKKLGWHKIT